MKYLPYEIILEIISFVDDVNVRKDFNIILPLKKDRYYKLNNLFRFKPTVIQDTYIRHFIPNKFESKERVNEHIDDDSMEIGMEISKDSVYYSYNLYIFKKSDNSLNVDHSIVSINVDLFCWHYKHFDYHRY